MDTKLLSGAHAPIDAVIMWVDGSDTKHANKLNQYLQSIGGARPQTASAARFHNSGEIDYCVVSLLKFAPWINMIYIVTDEQTPALINKIRGTIYEHRVKIIDHTIIFAGLEECLPTFNSMAISSLLWKIPNLSEHFIYFNDDFVLLRPVYPNDFFSEQGVVLRGKWKTQPNAHALSRGLRVIKNVFSSTKKKTKVSYWALQQRCGELLGFSDKYFRLPHTPHPWRKSSWQTLFSDFPQELNLNVHSHLRGSDQYVPESLSAHVELRNNTAVIRNVRTNAQLKPAQQSYLRIWLKLKRADKDENVVFSCIQGVEAASSSKRELIFNWLDQRIGSFDQLFDKKI